MNSLFKRDPETIDDYVPRFTYEECLMGYQVETHTYRYGFGGAWDENDPNIGKETYTYSITVMGHKLIGKMNDYYGDALDNAASIANEYTSSPNCQPEVMEFFSKNAKELNNSKRYWLAYRHRQEIEKQRKKAEELLRQVRTAEWIASMYAVQVKAERWLTQTEKDLLLAEFSGGEYVKEQ